MDVLAYVASESERQSATPSETIGMLRAHQLFFENYKDRKVSHNLFFDAINLINGIHLYRTVAVTFRQVISEPPSHTRVPYLMDNLIYNINEDSWLAQRANADLYTKEFLDIHPFTDGNGRIGSLLWNFLRGSLHEPETMPYFYGENHG
jgi:Fic family protein